MAENSIPVDLTNPGQVFACLGFLEAADVLLGEAEGGFDWSDEAATKFVLRAAGDRNPFEVVLEFLAEASVRVVRPDGLPGPWPPDAESSATFPAPIDALRTSNRKTFTASQLPIRLCRGDTTISVAHWLRGDGRHPFKLFAGKQVGAQLATNMLNGDPAKNSSLGFRNLFPQLKGFSSPFAAVCPVGGRFGFDARGGWDAPRAGTSLDRQNVLVRVAPHVELLAAIGLENARPLSLGTHLIRYAAWGAVVPVALCRAALSTPEAFLPRHKVRFFQAHLGDDQQYKKCFFAELEN